MPIIRSTKTGRKLVFSSGSPEGSANSTYLSRSKISGRMLYFKGVAVIVKDTYAYRNYPDRVHGNGPFVMIWWEDGISKAEGYIGDLPKEKKLNVYIEGVSYNSDEGPIGIYEVSNSWGEMTLTWNNRPAHGGLIEELPTPSEHTWWKISTGTTGAIHMIVKGVPGTLVYFVFSSMQDASPERPYITDT